jgi:hypothetical protein
MPTTTLKVPVELRDRLAEQARRHGTTLAGAIAHALEVAEEREFWDEVRRTMATPEARQDLTSQSEQFASTLRDGTEPDEDWSDLL